MTAEVDKQAVKFNQAASMMAIVIAFALNQPWLILLTCLTMVVGLAWPAIGPFNILYQRVFLGTSLLKPRIADEDPTSHRFASGLGATILALSSLLLLVLDIEWIGWALALIVALLAGVSAFLNF